jgi:DNA-binding NarL/FixJ family response regulator
MAVLTPNISGLAPARLPSVYLIEDSNHARAWMGRWLAASEGIRYLGACGSIAESRSAVAELRPDVLLLDFRLRGEDTPGFIRELVRAGGTRVLVISAYLDAKPIITAMHAGAGGFYGKDADHAELLAAIQRVYQGEESVYSASVRRALAEP